MDVWQEEIHLWLALEKAAIRHWVKDLGRPYPGICLGHQLMGEAPGVARAGELNRLVEPKLPELRAAARRIDDNLAAIIRAR